jgi:cob(I)alamin adenosyltransferase
MNYESQTTAEIKNLLDMIDAHATPEEIGTLERQLNEDDFKLAEWLAEEESKPELVRDLKREQIAVESLTARVDEVLKPMRESRKKSAKAIEERQNKKAAALAECNAICQRAHKELTEALQKHGVHANDTSEAIAKVLAYSGLAK